MAKKIILTNFIEVINQKEFDDFLKFIFQQRPQNIVFTNSNLLNDIDQTNKEIIQSILNSNSFNNYILKKIEKHTSELTSNADNQELYIQEIDYFIDNINLIEPPIKEYSNLKEKDLLILIGTAHSVLKEYNILKQKGFNRISINKELIIGDLDIIKYVIESIEKEENKSPPIIYQESLNLF